VTGGKGKASRTVGIGAAPRVSEATGDRFPGFDVLDQAGHWDPVTAGVVLARVGRPPDIRFFTPAEEAAATALCDRLLGQDGDGDSTTGEPKVEVVPQIDARLAEQETDGWRYEDMPGDGQAWRDSLRFLDEDSQETCSQTFAQASVDDQRKVIQAVQDLGAKDWHGLNAAHVWSLWTRYACTSFYAHPSAWNEIGFPGPAYPRGYKHPGVDRREPFEVADARPADDPVHRNPQQGKESR
jgi:gluconate 2-dehydrogenase subunit 3-like protein